MNKATNKATKTKRTPSDIEKFEALSEAEKEAVYKSLDREFRPEEMAPLTPAERKTFEKGRRRARRGRPQIGEGSKMIAVSIMRGLLKQADAFAKQNKVKRSEMVAAGLLAVLQTPHLMQLAKRPNADVAGRAHVPMRAGAKRSA
jgi:hypothetical protein